MCEHFFKILSLLYYKVVSFHSVHFNKCACWKICLICECSDLPWLDQKLSHRLAVAHLISFSSLFSVWHLCSLIFHLPFPSVSPPTPSLCLDPILLFHLSIWLPFLFLLVLFTVPLVIPLLLGCNWSLHPWIEPLPLRSRKEDVITFLFGCKLFC